MSSKRWARIGGDNQPIYAPGGIVGLTTVSNTIWYVDSGKGSSTYAGRTWQEPKATLAQVLALTDFAAGDVICIAEGHAETLTTTVTLSDAGIRIIGEGEGNRRPAFTCTFAAASDGISITAADVVLENLRFVTPTAAMNAVINVAAARAVIRGCGFAQGQHAVDAITVTTAGEYLIIEDCDTYVSHAAVDTWVEFEAVIERPIIRNNRIVCDGVTTFVTGAIDFNTQAITNPLVYGNIFDGGDIATTAVAGAGALVGDSIGPNTYAGAAVNADTTGITLADDAITAAKIAANAIGASEIANGAIDAATFAAGAIDAAAIANSAIDAATFAAGAIDAAAIANGAIDAATFAAGAIDAAAIANGAIDAATFAAGAIDAAAIAAGAIDAATFAAGAIDAAAIATDAIDADAIAAGAITADVFAAGAIDAAAIAAGAIDAATFAAGAIDAAAIAAGAIDAATFAAGAIDAAAIANGAIDAATFAAGAIDAAAIAAGAIDAATFAAGAIDAAAIAAGAIDAATFAAGAIDAAAIATNAIDADALAAGAITADVFAAGAIDAAAIAAGAIDAATFAAGAIDAAAIANSAIDAATFAAGAIDAAAIANGAIDAATFAAGAIDAAAIAGDAITNAKIADNALATEQFALSAGEKTTDGIVVTRATAALPQTTAAAIFTVTGHCVLKRILGVVTAQVGAVGNVTHLQVNSTGAGATTDICLAAAGLDITGDVVDTMYEITGTFGDAMVATTNLPKASSQLLDIVVPPGTIEVDCAGNDGGGGRVRWSATYVPMESGAQIVAA